MMDISLSSFCRIGNTVVLTLGNFLLNHSSVNSLFKTIPSNNFKHKFLPILLATELFLAISTLSSQRLYTFVLGNIVFVNKADMNDIMLYSQTKIKSGLN